MGALSTRWHDRFGDTVRFLIAPLVLFCSGFFTADFVLSGLYTWPRTSRVMVLTVTVIVLAYEFVYKEQAGRPNSSAGQALKTVVYSCALPYGIGALALLGLARLLF